MNVAITGIGGFVGGHISRHLHSCHHTIIGIDINNPTCPNASALLCWNDLGNLPQMDVFIHLAGIAHDVRNVIDLKEYMDVNVGLTKQIFRAFLDNKAEMFVFFSSVKAVADHMVDSVLTEEQDPSPMTPYGESKLEAEKYLLSSRLPSGKTLVILRPCMIHGPGNKGNLNLLFRIINRGIPYPLGAFENKRSFTSICNLNHVIQLIVSRGIPSGVYNIADDESVSSCQLIRIISASMNKKPRIWRVNRSIIRSFFKIGDFLHLPFNSERLSKLTESFVVSNQKIKDVLMIDRMPFSAREGLEFTLKSFSR